LTIVMIWPRTLAGRRLGSDGRTRSPSSCQGVSGGPGAPGCRAMLIGRKTGLRPIGRSVAHWPRRPRPEKDPRGRGDCRLSLGSGRLSHGVKARSSIVGYEPYLIASRLASKGQRNRFTEYLPSSKQI
jgi:hypothetical protein